MAGVYESKGDYDLALKYLGESLDIYNKAYNQNDHHSIVAVLNNIGLVYKDKGDSTKSIRYIFLASEMKKRLSIR
jgi:tetratricopeptide (TPR) repeat protein